MLFPSKKNETRACTTVCSYQQGKGATPPDVGKGAALAVYYASKVWRKRELKFAFLGDVPSIGLFASADAERKQVVTALKDWTGALWCQLHVNSCRAEPADPKIQRPGIRFVQTNDTKQADIRISFVAGASWAKVGSEALLVTDENQATINFGWSVVVHPETVSDCSSSWLSLSLQALHQIGHVLGFEHELLALGSRIWWNQAGLERYASEIGWTMELVRSEITDKVGVLAVQDFEIDQESIMMYHLPAYCYSSTPLSE